MAPHPAPSLESAGLRGDSGLRIEIHRLLSFILRRPIGDGENPSRAAEPGWDSLKHVELVFLIEDHFGMRFAEREIAELEDARQIERLIETRLLQRPLPEKSRGEGCGTA
jgi:acyl carrier protein